MNLLCQSAIIGRSSLLTLSRTVCQSIVIYQLIYQMKRRFSKQDDELDEFQCKKQSQDDESVQPATSRAGKKKKDGAKEQYKCGSSSCNKLYHSYTAFYNHCKKIHEGEFPEGSLVNNKIFEGPSKNRGRPRITKTETKNDKEIQAMKSENELIEFLGTLNRGEKSEEVIVYVENPLDHVTKSIELAKKWNPHAHSRLLQDIDRYNRFICEHDLPEFYDPIQTEAAQDKVDSYSFSSIFKFLSDPSNRKNCEMKDLSRETLRELTVVWLGRVVSVELLAEVIYVFLQDGMEAIKERERGMLEGKVKEFQEKVGKFVGCYVGVIPVENIKIEN